ncbi:TetR/AcrR family transcriptional regulator [Sessilibacter sp. MAH4]
MNQPSFLVISIMATERTSDKIIKITQELIQTRGYSAISFDDIAVRVGIKKPSIVHHFANKSELAAAVVDNYRSMFLGLLAQSANSESAARNLEVYFQPYLQFGESGNLICLCGALAGEFSALPESVQLQVSGFFQEQRNWICQQISLGINNNEFATGLDANATATWVLSCLQGALLVRRAGGITTCVEDAVLTIKNYLRIS